MQPLTLFDDTPRLNMADSIRMTRETLQEYRKRFDRWQIAWSGGKDSTATLTLIVWMIESGMIESPRALRVLYADTRMELPPLYLSAMSVIDDLRARDIETHLS